MYRILTLKVLVDHLGYAVVVGLDEKVSADCQGVTGIAWVDLCGP